MFHEGNHMLTHMINEKVWYPAWLGEGMAEYYGASDWDPATKTMTVGGIQSARLCVLWSQVEETKKWQELKALIETPRVSAIQYSWAWSLCHFLLNTPKYEKAFKKFFVAIGKDKKLRRVAYGPFVTVPPEEQIAALMKALKVKHLEEVQAEWHEYIKTKLALDKVKLDWAGAGWIMSLYGERKKAKEFFAKAVKESEQSGYVYYSYAKLLYDEAKIEEASEYAYKATEVDPLHARAWLLKGLCHVRKDKRDEGKRMIELAMEIDPDDERIWLEKAWLEDLEQEAGR
jgi:tetratricopeptide (TPR) repeat protein